MPYDGLADSRVAAPDPSLERAVMRHSRIYKRQVPVWGNLEHRTPPHLGEVARVVGR